jgi:hypothetical protein
MRPIYVVGKKREKNQVQTFESLNGCKMPIILFDLLKMDTELEDAECEGGDQLKATAEGGEPPKGMPGQLPTKREQPLAKDYVARKKKQALEKIKSLLRETVTVRTRNNGAITWMVIASRDPPDAIPEREHGVKYGLKGFQPRDFKRSEVT